MALTAAPSRYRLAQILLLLLFAVPALCQRADTAFIGNKVFVKGHGVHIYDSLEWQAMQWEKQHRTSARHSLSQPGFSGPAGLTGVQGKGVRVLSENQVHTLNICGVVASFTPGNDSIVKSTPFDVTFTSTSTNATSLTWYVNGYWNSTSASLGFEGNPPGLYEIKLVAQNGSCSDTATCYYYITGTEPADRENIKGYYGTRNDEHATTMAGAPSGGYLLGGYGYVNNPPWYEDAQPEGMLIKVAESGCIMWSKKIPTVYGGELYKVVALQEGGYACSGYNDNIAYLMKLDALGNTIWTKIYYFNGTPLNPQWIAETSDGGFALAGLTGEGITVVRTDAGGNVLWTRAYVFNSPQTTWYYIGGILVLGQGIYLSGNIYANVLGTSTPYGFLVKLNDADGSTLWTRQYQMNGSYIAPADMHPYGTGVLVNSTVGSTVPNTNNTLHFLDIDGNPLSSVTLSIPGVTYGLGWTTALPLANGSIYVVNAGTQSLDLQPGYAYHTEVIKLDAGLNPSWSLDYGHYGGGRYFFPAIGQNGTLAILGDEIGQVVNTWSSFSDKLMFKKFNDAAGDFSTTNYPCGFWNTTINTTPQTLNSQPFSWTSESTPAAVVTDTAIATYTIYSQVRYECPEFVDSCNFLKLSGTSSICDLSGNYTYRVHRNNACAQPIQWDLPSNVTQIAQTDSTVTLKFPSFGSYRIASSLPFACSPAKDSLFVTAASHSAPLNLGKDTMICPNNSFILHAGRSFLRYQWQDGNTDSNYTVSAPGTYFVQVADSCDNLLNDTIVISNFSDIAVNAGPDRSKCNADTLHLNAPSGYLSYSWSPGYNISTISGPQVVIDPDTDTSYILKAEKIAGCFAYDTIHVKVYHSLPIRLGADRGLCAGDSLLLDAGGGFSQYQWNTGASTEQMMVYNKGAYSIKATTSDGCISADTLRILSLLPLPVANLNHSPFLCIGEPRSLEAAPGYSYLWNNGSTGSSILVADTGFYSVMVTDANGCVSRDSVQVSASQPLPSDFLPGDTAICSYGKLELTSLESFSSYAWSTGSTSESITISKPGTYWLEVTDTNNCVGRDTLQVTKKDCMVGFYIPNAFTPGGAGNNLFRPLLFGNIIQYEFGIYNRSGQLIFHSARPGEGWDGNYQGIGATPGTFAWYCRFTLDGESQQARTGTVILIR